MPSEKSKIILYSAIAGISLWFIDATVDVAFFSDQSFLDSLFLDIEPHELYFRSLFLVSFLAFAAVIAGVLAQRRKTQEELKKAIVEAEEEKARSEAILAAIGDGISIQDRDFKVIYQNHFHKDLVGGEKTGEYC